ncbi:MAG TPA: hypothetical protein VHR18_13910, partial [Solirubrobacterales bacterium]|nr:hypothetical protein [Solirubrobacterales bacterium]
PLYTRYLTTGDYGTAEVLFASVVSISIIVRFGLIEALLRFYYKDDEDPKRVVASTFAALFWLSLLAVAVAMPLAEPISQWVLNPHKPAEIAAAPELTRIAIGGLWVLTMFEFMLTLFRLDERVRAYFVTTILNVVAHPSEIAAEFKRMREAQPAVDGRLPEAYEAERMDEDSRFLTLPIPWFLFNLSGN